MNRAAIQTATVALAIFNAYSVQADPATLPGPPAGYEEWLRTGQLPNSLFLHWEHGGNGAVISNPNGNDWPGFTIFDKNGGTRRQLQIQFYQRELLERSTHVNGTYIFDLGQDQVFPLFDQIYAVNLQNCASKELLLRRVTDRVPREFRPGLRTRTIATVAVSPDLFWAQHPKFQKRQDYDTVKLEFDLATSRVALHLYPTFMFRPPITDEEKVPNRERAQLEVRKGSLLTARGRSYRVLNVVLPQGIEGVGHLVGWIELAADPVELAESKAENSK